MANKYNMLRNKLLKLCKRSLQCSNTPKHEMLLLHKMLEKQESTFQMITTVDGKYKYIDLQI